jgi:microcystin-dependent protein
MTQYVKSTSFASKDALPQGNPLKIVKGTEIDTEFNNIAVAVATKADLLNPVFTGVPTAATATAGTSTTQIATTAFAVSAGTPTASLLMWPTATAPTGFLLCNGQAVSRVTYAALFAIVGVVFGAGDGATTFTLPDYRNKTVLGAGDLYSANSQGGSKDAILVSHTHTATVTDPSHSHAPASGSTFVTTPFSGDGSFDSSRVTGSDEKNPFTGNTATAVTGITVANSTAGVSGTNANLPPYLGIFFIIKT